MTAIKHTPEQCEQALAGIKDLIEQIKRIEDEDVKKHVCESAIDICNNLLRERGKEVWGQFNFAISSIC